MWIEITDETKRKVLINLDNVTQITESGEETDHEHYLFFFSILSNCYWVFYSKEEKEEEYNKLKISLGVLQKECDHLYAYPLVLMDNPSEHRCIKCGHLKTIGNKL